MMNRSLGGLTIAGIVAVAVILVALLGYHFLSGPKQGEKPHFTDPRMNRMYSGAGPTNAATQSP
jgi:hypothetical protein